MRANGILADRPEPSALDLAHRLAYRAGFAALRPWWRLRNPAVRGAVVALVALFPDGGERVLAVRHSYRPGWGLPAGGLGTGEDPLEGARRELREETGVDLPAPAFEPAWRSSFEAYGRTVEDRVFEARLNAPPLVRVDGREVVEARWFTPEEAARLEADPPLRAWLKRRGGSSDSG